MPLATDVMGDAPIVRVIGSDDVDETVAGLQAWVPDVVRWLGEGRTPYVFAHQPENLVSPELARRFHACVAEAVNDLRPLPEPSPVSRTDETGQPPLF